MPALLNVYGEALVHHGAAVGVLLGKESKAREHVQVGGHGAVGLNVPDILLDKGDKGGIYLSFNAVDFSFRPENLLFVVL